jgi:hypothetical protein
MTISTDSYTAAAGQAKQATEKSVEAWKNGAKTFTDQLDAIKLPAVDLTEPVARYFEYLQKAVDLNRELATKWAEALSSLSGTVREQTQKLGSVVQDQTDKVADLTVQQAQKAEQAAKKQAEQAEEAEKAKAREAKRIEREEAKKAQQEADEAEEAEKAKAREAKRIEREEAKKAQLQAREAYEGLTKAELSDQLSGRGLPKTGNIEDLIERLVSADSE